MSSEDNEYKYTGVTIYADGSKSKVEFNDFSTFVKREVGGYFECIIVPNMTIWVNEEGKLRDLQINKIASGISNSLKNNYVMYSNMTKDNRQILKLFQSMIAGNAVFLGGINDESDVDSLTDSQIDFLTTFT